MCHSYACTSAEETEGPVGTLMREMWSGDVAYALSRCKQLLNLHNCPRWLTLMTAWFGIDLTRPILFGKQVHLSLNRATLRHRAQANGGPATYQHIELTRDFAASTAFRAVWPHLVPELPTLHFTTSFVLEGRQAHELPERVLFTATCQGVQVTELSRPPACWPASPSELPGEMFGSYTTRRDAADPGSWQSTRAVLKRGPESPEKAAERSGALR